MAGKDHKLKDALQRAYELRYAEIGLYWQRALYLWGLTGLLLAAFIILAQESNKTFAMHVGLVLLPMLGFITAWAWYFTERGSKTWQYGWEKYIAYLEGSVTSQTHAKLLDSFDQHAVISGMHLSLFYIVVSTWLLLPVLAVRPFISDLLAYDDPGIWGWIGLCFVMVLVIYSFIRGYFETHLKTYARLRDKSLESLERLGSMPSKSTTSLSPLPPRPYPLPFTQQQVLVDIVVFFILAMLIVWPFLSYLEGFEQLDILAWLGIYFLPVVIICILAYDWLRKHWRVRAEMIGRIHRFLITLVVVMWSVLAVVSGRGLYDYGQAIIAEYVPLEFITERCSAEVIDRVEGWIPRGVVGGICHFLQFPGEGAVRIEGR